jgi:hypothetical protein
VSLSGTSVTAINVFGKGKLDFGVGSFTNRSLVNFGDERGLVNVQGGNIDGDLVGLGASITAMSGGHVKGSPVFSEQATFLYSGGTFDFVGAPEPAASLSGLGDSDVLGAEALSLSGFAARDAAKIQFIGFDLDSELIDPDFVQDDVSFSMYQLTGRLADGTLLDGELVYVENSSEASFALITVPEPSGLALIITPLLAYAGLGRRWR